MRRAAAATPEPTAEPSRLPDDMLLARMKTWFRTDAGHSEKWRGEARENFGFVAGDQWTKADRAHLEEQGRPAITFNRTLPVITAVAGIETNSRSDIVFMPRSTEDGMVRANELLSAASTQMGDTTDAEDEQSEAAHDMFVCGMGWVETRVSFDDDANGAYVETKIDPLEMFWDASARSKNLKDARRLWRVRKLPLTEARELADAIGAQDVPDEDLDAAWATGFAAEDPRPVEDRRRRVQNSQPFDGDDEDVTIVHAQWIERQTVYRVGTANESQAIQDMTKEEFEEFRVLAQREGIVFEYFARTKKVYKQALLGAVILGKVTESSAGSRFSFHCMTGHRDRNRGTWYGLARVMREPQMFANKWMSQSLHILNSTAKGGIVAERGAFADQRAAEDTYARPDAITWVEAGAVSGGKLMPKPGGAIPTGYVEMMNFAVQSITEVAGISVEMMGLRDANQPGILEAQRKQASLTLLATLFDSIKRFRKSIGEARLHYIQTALADGRFVRLSTDTTAPAVPLLQEKVLGDYEVRVSDAPTSPNVKEQTWAAIIQMLPLIADQLTPEITLMLLEYSPLPSALIQKLKDTAKRAMEPSPEADRQQAMMEDGAEAIIAKDRSVAELNRARAMSELLRAANPTPKGTP